jgi:hypothetical protein
MSPPTAALGDDPRRIREHLHRSRRLALEHGLPSVVVGVAGEEGDRLAPEFLAYVESALRVEDAVFRLTRERAVLFLADVTRDQAREIMARLAREFEQRFPALASRDLGMGFFEVAPGCADLQVKDVLPAVFPAGNADA